MNGIHEVSGSIPLGSTNQRTAIALVYVDFLATLCDLCLNSIHYLRVHHRSPGYLSGYSVGDEIIKVALCR